ncbi:hydroxyacyl-thioester dehydratase type 2, mitochondrial [Macrosteles quadrilineatus]|uniref:hydroxyacyl-thioester dehydratase type 2, mitochondrial n=1 Tax=Macrosteles quadrilineatus TaxID=74068 RepID=UPI0023E1E815|nr:hydroxyacyl-thioester dehydratase type 2, mitochondrial [Macrosteles quadrilineatus]
MATKVVLCVPTFLCFTRFYSTASKALTVGSTASVEKTISQKDVTLFSELSGDWNPVHHRKDNPVVHGALLNGFVSGVIGSKLPGPGTLLVTETLRFPNPCYIGDTVIVSVELTEIRRLISCKFNVTSKKYNNVVMEGEAKLLVKDI